METILKLDGAIIFIDGYKGSGKTNISMLLMEICHDNEYRKHFATNIKTESYYVQQITNYPDLEDWLKHAPGKKTYVLDEAGKHIKKLSFMTEQNKKIMDLIQLIRHYDCCLIGVAPSAKFVDSGFMDSDILDARISKISLHNAKVTDFYNNDHYFLNDLPKTSISYNCKDDAIFSMKKEVPMFEQPLCCQLARLYMNHPNMKDIGRQYNLEAEEVKREIIKHLKHTFLNSSQATKEVSKSIEDSEEGE